MFLPEGKRFDPATLSRREFLWMAGIAGTATAVSCAVNPVTGAEIHGQAVAPGDHFRHIILIAQPRPGTVIGIEIAAAAEVHHQLVIPDRHGVTSAKGERHCLSEEKQKVFRKLKF